MSFYLRLLKVHSNTTNLNILEFSKVMETLFIKCDATLFDKVCECRFSDKEIEDFTGLTLDQLNDSKDKMISLRSRSVIQALVLFIFKVRTGNSIEIISSVFQLGNE